MISALLNLPVPPLSSSRAFCCVNTECGVFTRGTPGGCKAKENSGEERYGDREGEDAQVGAQIKRDWKQMSFGHEKHEQMAAPEGEGKAEQSAGERQCEAFTQDLAGN